MEFSWILEPDAEYDVVDNRHDKGYKYLLQIKRLFIQLLRGFQCFRTWMKNILLRGMPKDKAKVIEEIIDMSKETNCMVYAIEEALKKEYNNGIKEGIKEGKINAILELLQDIGDLPQEIVSVIRTQNDIVILSKWLKVAAKVDRIEEFISKIKEVN